MKNELVTIGKFTIHGYGLMIAIGVIVAYLLAEYRARKQGLDNNHIFPLLVFGVGFGLVGAKVLYYITVLDEIIKNPRIMLNIADGFVVYGGIIAGILAGYIYCRIKKISFLQYLDLIVPSVALAQGFGRLGCLLAGCCYGAEAHTAFAITFTESAFAPNGIPLIPTQPMSSIFNFANFAVLCLIASKHVKPGKVSACYLLFYSVGRFVIEFFRGDLERGAVGVLSTSQFISIFIAAFAIVLFIVVHLKGKKRER